MMRGHRPRESIRPMVSPQSAPISGRPDFDATAASFDRHRAIPEDAAKAIRAAILGALAPRPRLLDLGAGSGRIGWPFVEAGDDYVGVDLSREMLAAFAHRRETGAAALVQADGNRLPFGDASFDAVLLVQVFGGLVGWRALLEEARRVLRADGALVLGRTVRAADGIDARMKRHLAMLLGDAAMAPDQQNTREDAERHLKATAASTADMIAASWSAERSPRAFLDRHAGGARFSKLPPKLRDDALGKLAQWAVAQFGSLDAACSETHQFELRIFKFAGR